jgi:glycosyltransferase involved in cell wall biosynthesis
MRIVIDAVGIDQVGGGRTSILGLLTALFATDPNSDYFLFVSQLEETLACFNNVTQRLVPMRNRFLARLWMQVVLPVFVRRVKADLVHYTKNLATFLIPCKEAITVHDLTTLILQDMHSWVDVFYWRWIEPAMVRAADRIFAVSESTKWDIVNMYGVPMEQVRVVHWAVRSAFRIVDETEIERARQKYRLPTSFTLFLGILAKKKNLSTLLRSLAMLRAKGMNQRLVIVGRRYRQSDDQGIYSLIDDLGLADHVQFTGAVPDEDLPALYNAAALYVLPSLHEGFGIPCLEAMACGTPVIASRAGALSEVVGDAGWLLNDPLDLQELAEAIEQVLTNSQLREDLIERGLTRVKCFSWEKAAQETLAVYKEMLGADAHETRLRR